MLLLAIWELLFHIDSYRVLVIHVRVDDVDVISK